MLTSESLKIRFKQVIEQALTIKYHYFSNRVAKKALTAIELEKGKLSSKSKKIAQEYAQEVLGWKGFAPWLWVYTHIQGEFKEGWLPDNYYGKIVIPKIQGDYGKISFLKSLTNKIFDRQITPDLAYYLNGFWFDLHFQPMTSNSLQKLLFSTNEKVVHKLDQSYQGKGVFVYNQNTFEITSIEKKGNGVLQKFIRQHAFFNAYTPHAVATIRVTTVVDSYNRIVVRACYLRLGRHLDTHVKSDSHIRIPIELESGRLYNQGYLANWRVISVHPDSLVPFVNQTIPNYLACINLVLQLHKEMPMVRTIGWDMIIDAEENPVVMEWNGYSNDIKFSEATQGPCFKDLGWNQLHN